MPLRPAPAVPLAALLVALCGACDSGGSASSDGATDGLASADAAADGGALDAAPDGPPDSTFDARPIDAAPDTLAVDAAPDTEPMADGAPDTHAPDAAPDGRLDAAPDAAPDGGPEWQGDGICDPQVVVHLEPIDRRLGTTDGAPSGAEPSCSDGAGASERVFTWVAPADGLACLSLAESGFDTVLHIRRACDDAETELGCSDDADELNLGVQSAVTLDVEAGARYFAFVDGYAGGDAPVSGAYVLEIGRGPCRDGGRLRCADDRECPERRVCDGAACVQCVDDGDCDDGFRCAEQRCEPGAMMGVGACAGDRLVAIDGFDAYEGNNQGAPVDDLGSCNPGTVGPEVAHRFVAAADGPVCARTIGSRAELDTVVYVREACAAPASEIVCHDDVADGVVTSAADFDAVAGQPLFIFVDTYTLADVGDYVLAVVPGPCADAPVCDEDAQCPDGQRCRVNACLTR